MKKAFTEEITSNTKSAMYNLVDPSPWTLLWGILLTLFIFSCLVGLPAFLPGSLQEIDIRRVPMSIGGACAIFFLLLAQDNLARLLTFHGFLISTLFIFLAFHVPDLDVSILVTLSLSACFFVSFGFRTSTKQTLEIPFLVLLSARFFVAPGFFPWEMALVIQLLFLLLLDFETLQEKRRVFFSLLIILMASCSFSFYGPTGVLGEMNPFLLLLLGSAGAGVIRFITTEGAQKNSLFLYLLSNITLGIVLTEEGKTLPKVTLIFVGISLILLFFLYLISLFKGETVSKVLGEFKTLLVKLFFPFLFLLNHIFLSDFGLDLDPWIASMTIQVCILLFLIFIMKK